MFIKRATKRRTLNYGLQILKRDGFKCQLCGYNKALNVHHKYYNIYPDGKKVAPWEYPDDCFITLCKKCHEKVHEKRQVKTYYRSYWS